MRKRECSRLLLVPVIVFVVLFCILPQNVSVGASPAISYEKSVKSTQPSEILARARAWVAVDVKYNQSTNPLDFYHGYRTDCSGFVTMAWGLPPNMPNGGLNTSTLSLVADNLGKALDGNGKPNSSTVDKLQPGDILLNQGSIDPHAIIFAGWIEIATTNGVNTSHIVPNPTIDKNDGNYYYDGIEENGGIEKHADGTYSGYAIEHTPDHPLNSTPFDFSQPWPYPYYPGYDSEGYSAWRFDATKAANLGLLPASSIRPGGQWVTPPSPKNGDTVTDVIHLVARAYPSHQGDPAISYVFFTINSNGSWGLACLPVAPPTTGDVFACDVNLKQLGIAYGQIQVSFDVEDQAGNMSLAPNGVHTLNHVPTATVPMPATQTSCPTPGTARAAVIEPLVLGKDQNVVYVDNEVTSNIPTSATLKRYDVTTHQTTTIINVANIAISNAQVSADGQWVLFVSFISHATAIQLVRMDGEGLQTLYCDPQGQSIEHVIWSPNMQSVVFQVGEQEYDYSASLRLHGQPETHPLKPVIYVLTMANGNLQSALIQPQGHPTVDYYSPRMWLDNTRLYVVGISEGDNTYPTNIYMLDFSEGVNQPWQNLQPIVSVTNDPGSTIQGDGPWFFDKTPDGTKMIIGQCFACTTGGFVGSASNPATISVQPITSSGTVGQQQTLFSSPSDQLEGIEVISDSALVFSIDNTAYRSTTPDTTRNGLWKVNLDGSGLTHLTTAGVSIGYGYASQLNEQSTLFVVSRDGSMYATSNGDSSGTQSLFFGSLNGGVPITFLSQQITGQIGGISIVGWTTM